MSAEYFAANRMRGMQATAGGFLLLATASGFHLLPYLYPYICSYYHYLDPTVTAASIPIISSMFAINESIAFNAGIILYSYTSFRTVFITLGLLQFGGLLLASCSPYFYLFSFFFSFIAVTGGYQYICIYCAWRYFEDTHKPFINSFMLTAISFFPLASSNIAYFIINPQNVPFDSNTQLFPKEISDRLPFFLRVMGTVFFSMILIGMFLIRDPIQIPASEGENQAKVVSNISDEKITWAIIARSLKNRDFLKITTGMAIMMMGYHFFLYSFKKQGLASIERADLLVNIVGNISVFSNTASRLFSGALYSKYGIMGSFHVVLGLVVGGLILLPFAASSIWSFGFCVFWVYWGWGTLVPTTTMVFDDLFGKEGALMATLGWSISFTAGAGLLFIIQPLLYWLFDETMIFILMGLLIIPASYFIFQTDYAVRARKQTKLKTDSEISELVDLKSLDQSLLPSNNK